LSKPISPEGGVDTHNIHNSMSTTPHEELGDVAFRNLRKFITLLFTYQYQQNIREKISMKSPYSGADPGFQVRGGALKKNCAERREARIFLGYFV
jgi:hypothetical protein